MRFKGKTVVITGGASGIGHGSVELFLREGATVADLLLSVAPPRVREAAAQVERLELALM